jgi:hypothetical protein
VKKYLLALFALCFMVRFASAQGTYVEVIINGLDPACQIISVTGTISSEEDPNNVTNVTFQMAGALTVYSAFVPTTSEAVSMAICVQPSPNCGFVTCVNEIIYANTMNQLLINMGGGITDNDQDGYSSETDCDDTNPSINPGMEEICGDFTDNNCNGAMDEGCGGGEIDNDNDGFNSAIDCNDADASIFPGAIENCDDLIDNNCNMLVNEGCEEGPTDMDMDGFYSNSDCNDMDPYVNPGMLEICADGIDNNCNGVVDEEGCTGGNEGCNPEIVLLSDSALWSETPGVVWILFPFDPSNNASFIWHFGDGNTSTEPFPSNIYDVAGTYTVCLTVMANGCVGTTCLTFTVTPEGDFLPVGMPMTGFTLNVVNAIPNNVNEVSANAVLEAYPCPFNDVLTLNIQSALAGFAYVACYDMTGALIAQEQIVVSNRITSYTLPTASWSAGTYTLVINTPSGSIRRVVMK